VTRPGDVSAWWGVVAPILAFAVGAGILIVQSIRDDPSEAALLIAASLVAAASGLAVDRWLKR
jgi:uncharacterized membrane protein YoaK (UPF0700 family)